MVLNLVCVVAMLKQRVFDLSQSIPDETDFIGISLSVILFNIQNYSHKINQFDQFRKQKGRKKTK